MPALDLALGHRMIRGATHVLDLAVLEPFGQLAGDVARSVVGQQAWPTCGRRLVQTAGPQRQIERGGDMCGLHAGAQLPGHDVAGEVIDDAVAHRLRNAVPHPLRARYPVRQGIEPALAVPVVPAIEGRPWNAELCQRVTYRQRRVLDQPDNLQLLGGGISHAASSPAPIVLFLSSRFSSTSSATTSFSALASRRRSVTSCVVADRAVSPARRFLPASRNSFD